MLEAIVIHKSFLRQLALLVCLLLFVFTATSATALETPPNVRWAHNATSPADASAITTRFTHCKLLSNGNLAITGQFTGVAPILGVPHQTAQDPTNGTFVALQSPAGDLLWLHRFEGASFAQLATDTADNIHLISYSTNGVSLLGTDLPAEPDSLLLFHLSLKADGTLHQLRRLGQMDNAVAYHYGGMRTACTPAADSLVIALEFTGTLRIDGQSYASPSANQNAVLWAEILADQSLGWAHHFTSGQYSFLGPEMSLPDGGRVRCLGFTGPGSFQGETYAAPTDKAHSLMVWLDAAGQVTKTARVFGTTGKSAWVSGIAQTSDGDWVLQICGLGAASLQATGAEALSVTLPEQEEYYFHNVTITRVAGDFSAIRWQTGSALGGLLAHNNLQSDQVGNLYAAFSFGYARTMFGGVFFQPEARYDANITILVKLSAAGQLLWIRSEKSVYAPGFSVAPDGVSYFVSSALYYPTNPSRIVSLCSTFAASPPEFSGSALTNQLAVPGSRLYFTPTVSSNGETIYYWYKDGVPVTNSTTSMLVITNVSAAHLGAYTVTASNQFGTVSAGPYSFTLAPPSKLGDAELLQHIDTYYLESISGAFSPNGKNHIVVGSTYGPIFQNPPLIGVQPQKVFSQTSVDGNPSPFFTLTPSGLSSKPKALILDDGSCFFLYTTSVRLPSNAILSQGWLSRTDATGNRLWDTGTTGPDSGSFYDFTIYQKTNVMVLAHCLRSTYIASQPQFTQDGLYLLRFSLDGALLDKTLLIETDSPFSLNTSLRLDEDGSGYVIGEQADDLTIPGGESFPLDSDHKYVLFRFNASGTVAWLKRLPSYYYSLAAALDNDSEGVVVAINFNGHFAAPELTAADIDYGAVVMRWNRDGHLQWQRIFDTPDQDLIHALTLDSAGQVILGLMTTGETDLDGLIVPSNPEIPVTNEFQPILVRLSRAGKVIDAYRPSADGPVTISDIKVDPRGRLLFTGTISNLRPANTQMQIGPYRLLKDTTGNTVFYCITTPLGPTLSFQPQGNELKLNWSEHLPGFSLESSTSTTGPWTPVTTSTNSITLDAGASGSQFFRLKETPVKPPSPK